MQKIVCIVGPTATGKTDLAFNTARKFNGELISADSVQVFQGLDIISGKDIPKGIKFTRLKDFSNNSYNIGYYRYKNIPIYLLDILENTKSFSVSQFQRLANKTIRYITKKGKLPIVVGGTGLYVKSIIEGIATTNIKTDLKLRAELENLSVLELQEKLQKLNKEKFSFMNHSDRYNKRRIIRQIEIISLKSVVNHKSLIINHKNESLTIGLKCDRKTLKQRIDDRVEFRLKNGAIDEVISLFQNYKNLSQQVKDANGYKQLFKYLNNEISFDEAIYRWKISEYRHAKNQMTWFKKYGNVVWFDINKGGFKKEIMDEIEAFVK